MDAVNEQMLTDTLRALTRAQKLFGVDTTPVDPPVFAPARDLEDGLGRGTFWETA